MKKMRLIKITTFSVLLVISACGGKKVIETSDDSADYASAVELPPLKKNASNQTATNSAAIQQQSEPLQSNLSGINATILNVSDNIKRARIDAQIDDAWLYSLDRLKRSAVTIHSRNWAATSIEVGCGTIDDGSAIDSERGWSIFNRANILHEYCVIELNERSGATIVSVHNRRGEEVSGTEAMTLLSKIIP